MRRARRERADQKIDTHSQNTAQARECGKIGAARHSHLGPVKRRAQRGAASGARTGSIPHNAKESKTMSKVLTAEEKRAKGYVEIGEVNGEAVFLPLNVTRSAQDIDDPKAREKFLNKQIARYLKRAEARGGETGPIEHELTPNGRCLIKQTGTRRWAFFSKEQLLELYSPKNVKAGLAFAKSMPDSGSDDAKSVDDGE